jgi:mannose-6-phosphate isomerase-like protein (cupin superfamily)
MTRLEGHVKKGWGSEYIFASTDKYAGKLLIFDKKGSKFSMHFHAQKDESWYVLNGSFIVRWIDTNTSEITEHVLNSGSTWHNEVLFPHQLEALEDNSTIIEVSTPDSVKDNYRVMPGDSQK